MATASNEEVESRIEGILDRRFRFAGKSSLCSWLRGEARIRLHTVAAQRGVLVLDRFVPEPLANAQRSGRPYPAESVRSGSRDTVEEVIQQAKLPSLPQVFHELQGLMDRDDVTVQDLGQVISLDPHMTTSILKLVNSALFGFRSSIDTVSRAIAVLGLRQISTLALGTLMLGLFRERPNTYLAMDKFWEHSIAVGMTAQELARLNGREGLERYFVAGLVHDVGWLALTSSNGELAFEVMRAAEGWKCPLIEAEGKTLGMTHAEIGAKMFEGWSLPANLVAAVRYHHDPSMSAEYDEPIYVHLADTIVKAMGYAATDDCRVSPVDISAWDALELKPEALDKVIDKLDKELATLCKVLQLG
ncbi:HDOD domain-containing protein [Desulfovibrio subterraneus]|uniref:HDOD domain-containing protein n=1 Tax=Desulfovibrio subterraneus TaxID=2718620 RepID=UPI0022B8FCD8|nr:HDOD domain-containing protein [Desulfovibrio subterraneus]WBF68587.1 HDOD domain-containing protein [Desulfovibrio subterraneus]